MDASIKSTNIKKQKFLLFLCWLVYVGACLGKYSYSANTVMFISTYGVSAKEAGLVSTLFFITYGCGQIINGIFCKHYDMKKVIPVCLAVSAAVNLVISLDVPFRLIKYFWLINGVVESVFWPSVVMIISRYFSAEMLDHAVVVMATTYAAGTFGAYGLSAFYVQFFDFKYMFLTSAVLLTLICVFYCLSYGKATDMPLAVDDKAKGVRIDEGNDPESAKKPKSALGGLFFCELIFLGVFAAANNLIKDGLTNWMPSILMNSYGLRDSISILLTLFLALIGIFGAKAATLANKKIKEFSLLSALFFALAAGLIAVTVCLLETPLWGLVLAVFGIVSLLMHAINNVITGMAPMYMRQKINAGMLSGILNGCCYVGSAISGYGLGAFADKNGWKGVFILFIIVCFVTVALEAVLLVIKTANKKKNA